MVATIVLNKKVIEVENKIPDTNSLVTTTVLNTKISEVKNKIPDHSKYITTQKFNMLTAENFAAKLKQANLVSKTKFDNRKITSNKTKYLEVLKKLTTKDYNFFLGRMCFTSNDGSQNTFVFSTNTLYIRSKKDKGIDYILS